MLVNPWDREADIEALPPDLTVFTLRLLDETLGPVLCDQAWTGREEAGRHFWMRPDLDGNPRPVEVLAMPLAEYLRLHRREIRGMNLFWSLGRQEFLDRWRGRHGPINFMEVDHLSPEPAQG
jgi:hypothetical protein